jgi:hypothetical protein
LREKIIVKKHNDVRIGGGRQDLIALCCRPAPSNPDGGAEWKAIQRCGVHVFRYCRTDDQNIGQSGLLRDQIERVSKNFLPASGRNTDGNAKVSG